MHPRRIRASHLRPTLFRNVLSHPLPTSVRTLLAIVVLVSIRPATAADKPAPRDLVLHEIRQSRDRIASLGYTCTVESTYGSATAEGRDGLSSTKLVHAVKQRGNLRSARTDHALEFRNGKPRKAFATRCVTSEGYGAYWVVGTGNAQQFLHDSPTDPAENGETDSMEPYHGIYIDKYAFGLGDSDFEELRSKSQPENWTVTTVKEGGEDLVQIEMRYPNIGRTVVVIDPGKGYTVKRVTSHKMDDSVRVRISVDARMVGHGIWFPTKVEETRFDRSGVASTDVMEVSDITVNEPIADEAFSIEAMELPEGTDVIQHRKDGSLVSYRMRSGKLIPLDVELELGLAEARLNKSVKTLGEETLAQVRQAPSNGQVAPQDLNVPPPSPPVLAGASSPSRRHVILWATGISAAIAVVVAGAVFAKGKYSKRRHGSA